METEALRLIGIRVVNLVPAYFSVDWYSGPCFVDLLFAPLICDMIMILMLIRERQRVRVNISIKNLKYACFGISN